ncbi:DUF58 domain-containing protein [Marinilabiliaceae bacterium ANBcel2]|nr:DUF58 domain-containing protein [Marinilabiliaceae bacterium ANBcel2]
MMVSFKIVNSFKSLYFTSLFYKLIWSLTVLFLISFFYFSLFWVAIVLTLLLLFLSVFDLFLLFKPGSGSYISAYRFLNKRFSNGDSNEIIIDVKNTAPFALTVEIIDEIPVQFQKRDFYLKRRLQASQSNQLRYCLTPVTRGVYSFGFLNVFVTTPLSLVIRRYRCESSRFDVEVYPSYIQMRRYQIMALSDRLNDIGVKKIRRIGHHSEFDQIREYIKGDDIRTINWKATARRNELMVNQYQDEKSQQVFSVVDMGRTMKMPFKGMTLLDYAINCSLVISGITMLRHDKAGLITFNDKVRTILPASRRNYHQIKTIMEVLYNQHTTFAEHNIESLYINIRRYINQRSLLFLYTNFESLLSAQREIPLLQKIASVHLLVVVFFENSEIVDSLAGRQDHIVDIYRNAVAEKYVVEKYHIAKELKMNGINVLLTSPNKLTTDTVNKYLEFKSRGFI